jgi:hypothetical protein
MMGRSTGQCKTEDACPHGPFVKNTLRSIEQWTRPVGSACNGVHHTRQDIATPMRADAVARRAARGVGGADSETRSATGPLSRSHIIGGVPLFPTIGLDLWSRLSSGWRAAILRSMVRDGAIDQITV